jgi:hypothetical protein
MIAKEITVDSVGRVRSFWFDSASEIMSMPLGNLDEMTWRGQCRNTVWVGCTLGQIREWIANGWPDGLKMIEEYSRQVTELDVLPSTAAIRRRRKRRGDAGDDLHMDRVWNGDLDNAWDRMVKEPQIGKSVRHVSLFVNIWTQSGVNWRDTLWRAVAVIKLADALQRSGRHVRITAGMVSRDVYAGWRHPTVHAFRVKDYNEPMNMQNLALTVTAMFLRTMGWRMYYLGERCFAHQKTHGWMGYLLDEKTSRLIWPHPIVEDEMTTNAMMVRIDRCYHRGDVETIVNDVKAQLKGEELALKVVGDW